MISLSTPSSSFATHIIPHINTSNPAPPLPLRSSPSSFASGIIFSNTRSAAIFRFQTQAMISAYSDKDAGVLQPLSVAVSAI